MLIFLIVVRANNDSCRTAMFKNARLRLLMTLASFERLGIEDVPGGTWTIPSSVSSQDLESTLEIVRKHEQNPPTDTDGQLRRKRQSDEDFGPRAEFLDDSEGASDGNEEFLFPVGPRPENVRNEALEELRKKRKRKRRQRDGNEEENDEMIEARRKAREDAALARRMKYKSDVYIHDSDEESDAEADREFFRKEEERRKKHGENILNALRHGVPVDEAAKKDGKKRKAAGVSEGGGKKRKRIAEEDAMMDEDDDIALFEGYSSASRRKTDLSSDKDESGAEDTPLSSQDDVPAAAIKEARNLDLPGDDLPFDKTTTADAAAVVDDDDDEGPVIAAPRRRARAGFIIDSDSE